MAIVTTDNSHYGYIAAAIREKAGGAALYKPAEMAAAIRAIQSGGGDSAAGVIDKSVTSITSNAAEVGQYAFFGCEMLETASFPMATKIQGGAFVGCKALVSVSATNVTEIRSDVTNYFMFGMDGNYDKDTIGAFSGCTALATVDLPMAETIFRKTFSDCKGLTILKFPRVKTIGESGGNGDMVEM